MKKEYVKPQMEVVNINHRQPLLTGSLQSIVGNTDIDFGGAGNEVGRAPMFDEMEAEVNALFGQ